MFVALLLATAAQLAPPPLAKLAIDEGIIAGRPDHARRWSSSRSWSARSSTGARRYVQTYLVGWVGQRVLQDLRIQLFAHLQTLSIGFYSRRQAGVIISRLTNDVAGARPARLRRRRHAVPVDADAGRHGGDPASRSTPQLALLTFIVFPVLGVALAGLPDRLGRRLPAHAREGRADHRLPAGDAVGHPRRALVRPGAAPHRALRRAQRGEPRREHEDRLPQRRVLPGRRAAVRAGHGRDPALRRRPGDQRRHHGRRARRLRGRAEQLLRPDPAALPALHDLPGGHGGAGQDLRAARRGARPGRRARRARARPRLRGEIALRGRVLLLRLGRRRRAVPTSTCTCRRARPWRWSARPAPGKSTFAKLVARFYDPTVGARPGRRPRPARRHRALAALSRWASCRRRRSCSAARSARTSPSGARTRRSTEVEAAARAVGAHDFIAALDDGYETQVGERGVQLSAGQRQLVAFARALVADPRILVLDEATSNVDIHTEGKIEAGLRRLLAGRTAIVIAHRLSTIRARGPASWCSTTAGSSSRARTTSCWPPTAPTGRCTATGREQAAA